MNTQPDPQTPKRTELDEFMDWAVRPEMGCMFGSHLARNLGPKQWWGAVIKQPAGKALADELDDTAPIVAGNGPELFHAVLPRVNKATEVIDLLRFLCEKKGRWYAYEVDWEPTPNLPDNASDRVKQALLVGLRWKLSDKEHVSWSLGFGRYQELPWTRRAPYTSLIMRVTPPKPEPGIKSPPENKREYGLLPVHLAHMASGFTGEKAQENYDRTSAATRQLKRQWVEPKLLPAARGRVTFSFPLEMADRLDFLVKYADVVKSGKDAGSPAQAASQGKSNGANQGEQRL